MDQAREDFADPEPLPQWFELSAGKGTIGVVCGAVLLAFARAFYIWYSSGR